MLNITKYQGNANQNTMSHHPIPVRVVIIKKNKTINVGSDMEKLESMSTVDKNVK